MNDARKTICLACLGLACIPVYAVNFGLAEIFKKANLICSANDVFIFFLCRLLVLSIFYLLAARAALQFEEAGTKSAAIFVVLFFSLLFRLLVIPTQPFLSSDIYRYIWDGRVQASGINPYLHPPDDGALRNLQDEAIYAHMNRRSSPTIYPAGAQMLFHALNKLKMDAILSFKGAVVLFDMGSVLVLMMILSSLGLARERVLIYAWHPLVVFEIAGSGHLEGFMLFFVLLCLLLMIKKRPFASVTSLALAASLKLYPAILLPAVLKEKKVRGLLLFSAIFLLIYLPYMGAGSKVAGFLPEYFSNPDESFNLGVRTYLIKFFPGVNPLVFTAIFAAVLLCAAGLVWVRHKDTGSALKFSYCLASLQIVLTAASLHPWYVIWIIPFLAIFPSPAWLYFSFAVCLSYLAYGMPGEALPGWVRHVEYIPFLILLATEFLVRRKADGGRYPWNFRERKQTSVSQGVR
jgi:hypothetical protein